MLPPFFTQVSYWEPICKEEKEHLSLTEEVRWILLAAVIWRVLNNSWPDKQWVFLIIPAFPLMQNSTLISKNAWVFQSPYEGGFSMLPFGLGRALGPLVLRVGPQHWTKRDHSAIGVMARELRAEQLPNPAGPGLDQPCAWPVWTNSRRVFAQPPTPNAWKVSLKILWRLSMCCLSPAFFFSWSLRPLMKNVSLLRVCVVNICICL